MPAGKPVPPPVRRYPRGFPKGYGSPGVVTWMPVGTMIVDLLCCLGQAQLDGFPGVLKIQV